MRRSATIAALALWLGSPALSQAEAPDTQSVSGTQMAPDESIEEIRVVYPPPASLTTTLPDEVLLSGRPRNLSEAIEEIPGVSGVRRGASGVAPVIRGLGWERVPVQLQGLPVFGAGPGQMDTPATLFGPSAIQEVEVVKGLPSVTLGPGGTGGFVLIDPDYERDPGSGTEVHGGAMGSYATAGDRFSGGVVVHGGTERLDAHMGVDGRRSGDYESAGGIGVPDSASAVNGSLSLGYRPAEGHRASISYIGSDYWDEDFPSLPMDNEKGWMRMVNTGYRYRQDEGMPTEARWRFGYSGGKHWMNNDQKNVMMQARTLGKVDSYYTSGHFQREVSPALELSGGLDFNFLDRDARRTRIMPSMPTMPMKDHLWPDVYQWDVGLYSELQYRFADDWRLRAGARFDQVESDARAADDASLGGMTVREAYAFFNGPEAAIVRRSESLGSGNALVEWRPTRELSMNLGAGVVSRAPSATERYFAFAPAPGGFLVGNPALDPEYNVQVELGARWSNEFVDFSAQIYHAWVHDYILRVGVLETDVDGDDNIDIVRSFENVDARLYGGEANITLYFGRYVSLPMTFAYVRGRNTSEGRDLPEIPPFDTRIALRVEAGDAFPWWAQFGARLVAGQDRIDREFPENATPSFEVFHLRGGVGMFGGGRLEMGIENLFDADYHEHLTREVPVPVADLARGDEIPAPGRYFYVSLGWEF